MKNIVIVSFFDDNFGDMLIRICFDKLLKVAILNINKNKKNWKVEDEFSISYMSLRSIENKTIAKADLVCFSGGGLFGASYLSFAKHIEQILSLTDIYNIPVIFSSMGLNNMDASENDEHILSEVLKHSSVKAISVRENLELFQGYVSKKNIPISLVCDPACWAKSVYHKCLKNNSRASKPLVGINVVRDGLFQSNNHHWKMCDEIDYIRRLITTFNKENIDYILYTNGSFLDNNTLLRIAKELNLPDEKISLSESTRELVETIYKCDYIAAIRLHSSIIAYAMGIFAKNIIWNDKVPWFYKYINRPNDAFVVDENFKPEDYAMQIVSIIKRDLKFTPDSEYLMSLYRYVYNEIFELFYNNKTKNPKDIFTFEEVAKHLMDMGVDFDKEDIRDYRFKLVISEKKYFKETEKLKQEVCQLNNNLNNCFKELRELRAEYDKLKKG